METGSRKSGIGPLGQYGRALLRAANAEAVADAERTVSGAWAQELLRLRKAAMQHLEAAQSLLDVIAEELGQLAAAADDRDRMVQVGRLRAAMARAAVLRPQGSA